MIPQFGLSLRLLAHCVGIYLLCGYCRQACGAHHLGTSRFFWALSAIFNGVPFLLLAVTGRFTEVYHGFVFQFAAHKFGYSQGERVEWVCKAMVLGWMPIATWLSRIVLSKTRAEDTGAE